MKLVIGLGNPGDKYKKNRHNAGWLFLDNITDGAVWKENKKFQALICEKDGTMFVKPLTFMNNSGESVLKIMSYYKLIPKKLGLFNKKDQDLTNVLTVIQDELDLNFGSFKISNNSGSAGHRGIASIINHLKTQKFQRVRIGIKNEDLKNKIPTEKFVLQNFSQEEMSKLINLAHSFDLKNII